MWIRSTKAFNTHWKNYESRNLALKETAGSNFKSKKHEGSGNELVDYSRAPCLSADQKARGLWERDWPTERLEGILLLEENTSLENCERSSGKVSRNLF